MGATRSEGSITLQGLNSGQRRIGDKRWGHRSCQWGCLHRAGDDDRNQRVHSTGRMLSGPTMDGAHLYSLSGGPNPFPSSLGKATCPILSFMPYTCTIWYTI